MNHFHKGVKYYNLFQTQSLIIIFKLISFQSSTSLKPSKNWYFNFLQHKIELFLLKFLVPIQNEVLHGIFKLVTLLKRKWKVTKSVKVLLNQIKTLRKRIFNDLIQKWNLFWIFTQCGTQLFNLKSLSCCLIIRNKFFNLTF